MAIAFDAGSNSGVKSSTAAVTYAHTTGTISNGVIVVIAISRGGAVLNTDPQVSTVTYNLASLAKAVEVNSGDEAATTLVISIWYLKAPASGSNNVIVTFSGTVNNTVIYTATLSGVDQTNPLDATASSHALGQASPDTTSITTVADNAWIVDGIYNKIGTALTRGASQNLIAAETLPNGGGDTADASYKGANTPAGSFAMSWTFTGTDDYAQALASFKPVAAASTTPHLFGLLGIGA